MSGDIGNLYALLPLGILIGTGVLLLLYEVFGNQSDRTYSAHVAVLGLGGALALCLAHVGRPPVHLFTSADGNAAIVVDAFSLVASSVFIVGAMIAALLSPAYVANARCAHGEYYALIVFAVAGMMVMAMASDLFTLFLGLETMSIAVYALTGIRFNDPRSSEAALKYFLMGAFATGFLLFGIALVYGAVGSVHLDALREALSRTSPPALHSFLSLGLLLLLIGFAFKIAAVPFHMWAPDVYEGAPTPVTGFMAVGVKAAAFVGLLRVVVVGLGTTGWTLEPLWISLLGALTYLTIIGGNVLALVQTNVKRMLAYSSIAHAGYALIGLVAVAKGEPSAGSAVLFYLASYTFMTLGAFGVLTFLERKEGGTEAERFGAFAGMGFKHPGLGLAMSLFMLALAGIPPTGGFFGKLYLFSAAIRADALPLALVGVLGSLLSLYYYLRVVVAFYMRDVPLPGPTPTATRSTQLAIGVSMAAFGVLHFGVFPSRWIELGQAAIRSLVLS